MKGGVMAHILQTHLVRWLGQGPTERKRGAQTQTGTLMLYSFPRHDSHCWWVSSWFTLPSTAPVPVCRVQSEKHNLWVTWKAGHVLEVGLIVMSIESFAWCLGGQMGEEEVKWEMPKQIGRAEYSSYHFRWWCWGCPSPWSCVHTWSRSWRSWGPGQQISSKSGCPYFLYKIGSKTITHTWVCDNSQVILISI